jgi:hypothetical protein
MNWVIWSTVAKRNVCYLEGIDNVPRSSDLDLGIPFGKSFPKDARMEMSTSHKKDTGLNDELPNDNDFKVCSKRLVDFLRGKNLPAVEYLPVKIIDHKGKVASADYFIVHPINPQPALDLKASKPSYNHIFKAQIDEVERLVLDPKGIAPGLRMFRLVGLTAPVLVDRALADEMTKQKFVGTEFVELEDWEQ